MFSYKISVKQHSCCVKHTAEDYILMEYNTALVCSSSRCCIETYRLHLLDSRSSRRRKKRRHHHHKNACDVWLTASIVSESNNYEVIQPNKHTRRLQASAPNAASSDCAKTGWYINICHYVIAKIYYLRQMSKLRYQIKHVFNFRLLLSQWSTIARIWGIVLVSMETKDKSTNNALVRINYVGSHYMTGWPMFTR
jgi:hypothetical protein